MPSVMRYPSAPSGEIYTLKWELPYVEVKRGYGFKGVLCQDVQTKQMQCHICGKWFELLASHVSQTHKMKASKYKETYGLLQSTALSIERIRIRQSDTAKKNMRDRKLRRGGFEKNNRHASNRKGKQKGPEWENRYGICERQIVEKVIRLADKLGETPSLIDLANEYGSVIQGHIRNKFGSYIKLCRREGLEPRTSNYNPKYSRAYFIHRARGYPKSMPLKYFLSANEQRAMLRYFKNAREFRRAAH